MEQTSCTRENTIAPSRSNNWNKTSVSELSIRDDLRASTAAERKVVERSKSVREHN